MTYIADGRCRSGRRWFWIAASLADGGTEHKCDDPVCVYGGPHEYGWEDTEELALKAKDEAITGLADAVTAARFRGGKGSAGMAAAALKRINAAKRRAGPAAATADAGVIEYLYGTVNYWPDDGYGTEVRKVVPFRVTRKTAKRIYYIRRQHAPGDVVTGYIDRQVLERDGEVRNRGTDWFAPDGTLYGTREAAEEYLFGADRERERQRQERGPDLKRLRQEMAGAHPDRGGTDEQFMAARERYKQALREAS